MTTRFSGGPNIAMKVPPESYEKTIAFYRDTLGLEEIADLKPHIVFSFGACRLWIDRAEGVERAELWLEIEAHDMTHARGHLSPLHAPRADAIEPLPRDFDAFWIENPADVVHLVRKRPQP